MILNSSKRESRLKSIIKVSGSNREMGRKVGRAASNQVRNSLKNARQLLINAKEHLGLSWEEALEVSRPYQSCAREAYPQLVDELIGYAEGAGVPFDEIFLLNAMEEITSDALHLSKCTSLAVNQERTADKHVLVAHNEDWTPEDEADVLIIHAEPDNAPAFLAMTYGGLLPNIGFNAAGIAQCCNTVNPADARVGVPRVLVARAALSARTLLEAIQHITTPNRAAGYNHLLASRDGEIINVEVSASRHAIIRATDGFAAHTNHYLDAKMRSVEKRGPQPERSIARCERVVELVEGGGHTIQSLQAVLKDHARYPDSICCHMVDDPDPLGRKKTITSLVMDLTTHSMYVTRGNPCLNDYTIYGMDVP
jgi:isopenicillin-N N-acyltransferase-like protein